VQARDATKSLHLDSCSSFLAATEWLWLHSHHCRARAHLFIAMISPSLRVVARGRAPRSLREVDAQLRSRVRDRHVRGVR